MSKKKMKYLSFLVAVVLVAGTLLSFLSWLPGVVKAAGAGSGTVDDPYIITTADELNNVRKNLSAHYKLGADIDLSRYSNWTPIGTSGFDIFTGSFDGDDYTISNLSLTSYEYTNRGLFGNVNTTGRIQNVHLSQVSVTGRENVGALIGNISQGTVENCSVSGGRVSGNYSTGGLIGLSGKDAVIIGNSANVTLSGMESIGGLIGKYSGDEPLADSHASGDVSGSQTNFGGLVGKLEGTGGIVNSYAEGNVESASKVGGLVGMNNFSSIEDSHATGNVTSTGGDAGGLVGENRVGEIHQSYATGDVTINRNSPAYIGGLVGNNMEGNIGNSYATGDVIATSENVLAYLGGLAGRSQGSIKNTYSVGLISGADKRITKGGLIGMLSVGTLTNSFYDSMTTGQNDTKKGVAKTTAEMMNAATFTGWDFNNVWTIDAGNGYPELRPYVATYRVIYKGNGSTGGSTPLDTQRYLPGDNASVLANSTLTRAKYVFAGWNAKADGSGQDYAPNDTLPIHTANFTLYAKWTALTYTIAPLSYYPFPELTEGYAPGTQQTKSITITRTGTGDLNDLKVTLSGKNASSFELTGPVVTTLNDSVPTTTFTVKTKDNLPQGAYSATVTVSATFLSPTISFTVEQDVNKKKTIPGDGNGDGKVNSSDALLITLYLKNKVLFPLTPEQIAALDMDGDGQLTNADIQLILNNNTATAGGAGK